MMRKLIVLFSIVTFTLTSCGGSRVVTKKKDNHSTEKALPIQEKGMQLKLMMTKFH